MVEIGTESRELPVEQIVHEAIDLQFLGELIRTVQVCNPVVRQFDILVGLVADVPLAADPDHIGTQLQCRRDRKSTRLNSSHTVISYAVFCLKKKKKNNKMI